MKYLIAFLAAWMVYAPAVVWALPSQYFFRRQSSTSSSTPIEFVAAAGNNFSGTRSPTVNHPTAVANDVWIAVFGATGTSDYSGTPPSGWTKLHEADGGSAFESGAVFWRRATGSEGGSSYWENITANNESGRVIVLAYRNCIESGSPINASATPKSDGSTTAKDSNVVTSTVDNCMIVCAIVIDPGSVPQTFTWDSPIDERIDSGTTPTGQNADVAGIYVGDKIFATAGGTTLGGDFPTAEHAAIFAYALTPK